MADKFIPEAVKEFLSVMPTQLVATKSDQMKILADDIKVKIEGTKEAIKDLNRNINIYQPGESSDDINEAIEHNIKYQDNLEQELENMRADYIENIMPYYDHVKRTLILPPPVVRNKNR